MRTPIRPDATARWSAGRAAACVFIKVSFIALRILVNSKVAGHITRMLRASEKEQHAHDHSPKVPVHLRLRSDAARLLAPGMGASDRHRQRHIHPVQRLLPDG